MTSAVLSGVLGVPFGEAFNEGVLHPGMPALGLGLWDRQPFPLPGALLRPRAELLLDEQGEHGRLAGPIWAELVL